MAVSRQAAVVGVELTRGVQTVVWPAKLGQRLWLICFDVRIWVGVVAWLEFSCDGSFGGWQAVPQGLFSGMHRTWGFKHNLSHAGFKHNVSFCDNL